MPTASSARRLLPSAEPRLRDRLFSLILSTLVAAPTLAFATAAPVLAAGPADAGQTTITADANSVSVDGGATITVQAKDSSGADLTTGGDTVTLSADHGTLSSTSGTTDSSGQFQVTLNDTIPEVVTVSGTINGSDITDTEQVTFEPGAADTSTTTITADSNSPSVDDSAPTITVQAKDQYGNDLTTAGDSVTLSADHGTLSSTSGATDSSGQFQVTLSDMTAEVATVSGTINTDPITSGDAVVTFEPGAADPSKTTISASPNSPSVDDPAPTITVQAKDQYGNDLTTAGDSVTLSADHGTLSSTSGATDSSGQFQVTLSDMTAEVATVSGTINGTDIADTEQVTFEPGAATHFDVSGHTTPTLAGDSHTLTVIAKDQYDNDATGYIGTITFSSSDAQAALPNAYTFVTGDNGSKSFSATLKTAGSQSLTATDTVTSSITGSQSGITVYPAPLDHFVVEKSGGGPIGPETAGTALSIQVTAKDEYGNTLSVGPNTFTGKVDISSTQTCSFGCGTTSAFSAGVLSSHSVTLTQAAFSGSTITATRTAGSESGTSNAFAVNPAPLDHFVVEQNGSGPIGTQTAGSAFSIQVAAKDQYGNTLSFGPNTFTGTVDISSNRTCSSGCGTTAAFSFGVLSGLSVTLTQAAASGSTITATKTGGTEAGTSNGFTVKPGPLDHFVFSSVGTEVVGVGFTVTVTAYDYWNNVKTDYTGAHADLSGLANSPGCPSCSAPGGVKAATYGTRTWPPGTGVGTYAGVTAYKSQAGAQLTISDTSGIEGSATNTSNAFTVTPAAAKYLLFSDGNIGFDGQPIDTKVSQPIYHVCVPSGNATGNPCVATSSTPLAVVAVDQYGNRVSGVPVTIATATPQTPPGSPISTAGTKTALTQGGTPGIAPYGEAPFTNLTIGSLQTYVLNASASGVTAGTSGNFRIVADLQGCAGKSQCKNSAGNGKGSNAVQYAFGQINSTSTFSSVVLTTQFSAGSDTSNECGTNHTIGDSIELRAAGGTVIPTTNGYMLLIIPKNTLKANGVLSRGTPSFNVCLGAIYLGDTNGNAYGTSTAPVWLGKTTSGSGLVAARTELDSAASVWRYWGIPADCGTAGLHANDPCIYLRTKQKSAITTLVNQGVLATGADTNMRDADLAIVIRKPNPWDGRVGGY